MYAPPPQQEGMSTGVKVGIAVGVLVVLYLLFKDKVDAALKPTNVVVTPVGPTNVVPNPSGSGSTAVTPAVVTVTPAAPQAAPSYAYKGCYVDDGNRVLPRLIGPQVTIEDCAAQARAAGNKVFGIQYSAGQGMLGRGGECWIGNDSGYDRLGAATNCENSGGRQFGGAWSNAVYSWDRL